MKNPWTQRPNSLIKPFTHPFSLPSGQVCTSGRTGSPLLLRFSSGGWYWLLLGTSLSSGSLDLTQSGHSFSDLDRDSLFQGCAEKKPNQTSASTSTWVSYQVFLLPSAQFAGGVGNAGLIRAWKLLSWVRKRGTIAFWLLPTPSLNPFLVQAACKHSGAPGGWFACLLQPLGLGVIVLEQTSDAICDPWQGKSKTWS